jgi:hypothetical protein
LHSALGAAEQKEKIFPWAGLDPIDIPADIDGIPDPAAGIVEQQLTVIVEKINETVVGGNSQFCISN